MDTVRNDHHPLETVRREHSLDDVVVAVQEERTAVAQMREAGEPGIDRPRKLLKRRVTVARRHHHTRHHQPAGCRKPLVAFRREREQPHKALPGIEHLLRHPRAGRQHVRDRMGPHVSRQRADEWPLHVDPGHHVANSGILRMEGRQPRNAAEHAIEPVGDHRGQNASAAIGPHRRAGVPEPIEREVVSIEIHALVAIELEVERFHRFFLGLRSSGGGIANTEVRAVARYTRGTASPRVSSAAASRSR